MNELCLNPNCITPYCKGCDHSIAKHIDRDTAGALQITENDHQLLHDLGLDWNPGDPNEYWERHE